MSLTHDDTDRSSAGETGDTVMSRPKPKPGWLAALAHLAPSDPAPETLVDRARARVAAAVMEHTAEAHSAGVPAAEPEATGRANISEGTTGATDEPARPADAPPVEINVEPAPLDLPTGMVQALQTVWRRGGLEDDESRALDAADVVPDPSLEAWNDEWEDGWVDPAAPAPSSEIPEGPAAIPLGPGPAVTLAETDSAMPSPAATDSPMVLDSEVEPESASAAAVSAAPAPEIRPEGEHDMYATAPAEALDITETPAQVLADAPLAPVPAATDSTGAPEWMTPLLRAIVGLIDSADHINARLDALEETYRSLEPALRQLAADHDAAATDGALYALRRDVADVRRKLRVIVG